jgi:hypothetical protein
MALPVTENSATSEPSDSQDRVPDWMVDILYDNRDGGVTSLLRHGAAPRPTPCSSSTPSPTQCGHGALRWCLGTGMAPGPGSVASIASSSSDSASESICAH